MKIPNKYAILICITMCIVSFADVASAVAPETGEEALFTTSTSPDALILLDLSGSMAWNPPGDDKPYGNSLSCTANTTYCTGTGCTGGFCGSSKTNCSVNCSRLAIAKRAIFDLLDDNDDNVINSQDEGSLGVRVGYMNFYNCTSDDTGGSYTSGCIQIPGSSSTNRRFIGSKYSQIYCNSNSSCTVSSTGSYSVGGASTGYYTPIASALSEAKIYLDAHKAADSAAACRQKFVIFVTDGSDTLSCGADGNECDSHRYKGRRKDVARAKELADAGYKVFIIGFGSDMPSYLQNTLNWMAYYGKTDNPNVVNSGSTTGYNITTGCDISTTPVTNPTACCNLATNPTACYPSGVTDCGIATSTHSSNTDASGAYPYCVNSTSSTNVVSDYYAVDNDPGRTNLSGYAFLAGDADQLAAALKTAMGLIREATYSFSQSSVQSSRTQDENYLYEGSFQPVSGDPFWRGHLIKYAINADGSVGTAQWDASDVLQATSASLRNMFTYKGGVLTSFTTSNITAADLGVSTTTERDDVLYYIRGESAYNPDTTVTGVFKLGDVFRSTPITVGTPSAFFDDIRDQNNAYSCTTCTTSPPITCTTTTVNAFGKHRCDHERKSALGNRLIVVGANDGQMHAFLTSTGSEAWNFIPPNLLPKLKNITHKTHPTALTHQYFVDGPVTVADVWLGTGGGTSKNKDDWYTIMVFGEGRGSTPNLWSSSSSCDSGFSATYTTSYPYYCGYYAFNLNNSLSPAFMWRISANASQAPYLGDPWAKMMTGRVKYNSGGSEVEKWVGFIGAGYNAADCSGGGGCDTRGKGFLVVDLSNGQVLWSYTLADNADMKYSIPGSPAVVDTDNDGFVDTAYVGDLGGSVWRFKFCRNADMPSCTTANWTGGRLFGSSTGTIRPIYTMPAVARDGAGNLWVYWGSGDKADPTSPSAQEKFFALMDNDRTTTYGINDLDNITSAGSSFDQTTSTKKGYYVNLSGSGEKILADPAVFGGVVYFTTFNPPSGGNPCEQGGAASLFALKYTSGAGALSGGSRSTGIGSGIASAPILSLKPGGSPTPDLYVTVSGGAGTGGSTFRVNIDPPGLSNRTNILFWRDRRLQ